MGVVARQSPRSQLPVRRGAAGARRRCRILPFAGTGPVRRRLDLLHREIRRRQYVPHALERRRQHSRRAVVSRRHQALRRRALSQHCVSLCEF